MQAPPAFADPSEHWHSTLPEGDSELAGHATHAAVPTTPLKVPAKHAAHDTPSAPVYPAEHWHNARRCEPEEENELAGHVSHAAAPTASVYVPASHAAQFRPPPVALYDPAAHGMHPEIAPDTQLAVKEPPVPLSQDPNRTRPNRTRRCCPAAANVPKGREPPPPSRSFILANGTTSDEHVASPHSSTYTQ